MGRIKSKAIKKTARQLIAEEDNQFDENFENNKKLLKDSMPSKPIKNKIAGYISRLIKIKNLGKKLNKNGA